MCKTGTLGDRRLTPMEMELLKRGHGEFQAMHEILSRATEPTLFELAISELAAKMDGIYDLLVENLARSGITPEEMEAIRRRSLSKTSKTWPRTSLFW